MKAAEDSGGAGDGLPAAGLAVSARPGRRADPTQTPSSIGQPGWRQPPQQLALLAATAGLHHIQIVAWRDLDHPEAGGSEMHAARIAERWAAAGIDVEMTTSRAPGALRRSDRDGYRTNRPAGRYLIFPATVAAGLARRRARPDGVVEIWNGMPFLSPLWAPHPRVTFLHHVHGGMWDVVLPPALAGVGRLIERRFAPLSTREHRWSPCRSPRAGRSSRPSGWP